MTCLRFSGRKRLRFGQMPLAGFFLCSMLTLSLWPAPFVHCPEPAGSIYSAATSYIRLVTTYSTWPLYSTLDQPESLL